MIYGINGFGKALSISMNLYDLVDNIEEFLSQEENERILKKKQGINIDVTVDDYKSMSYTSQVS